MNLQMIFNLFISLCIFTDFHNEHILYRLMFLCVCDDILNKHAKNILQEDSITVSSIKRYQALCIISRSTFLADARYFFSLS